MKNPPNCAHPVVRRALCGLVPLAVNCFSSRFIMAQGESRRQRTFLERRLQTASLVSNLLAPITSNRTDIQLFSESEKHRQTSTGSSSSKVGNDCTTLVYFQPNMQEYLGQMAVELSGSIFACIGFKVAPFRRTCSKSYT